MKIIHKTYFINAPVEDVWEALIDPDQIEEWSGDAAEMSDKEGASFKLWGGDIYGTNKEVLENKRLVQDWYSGKWKEPSILTIELFENNGETRVELVHENVPEEELGEIDRGWDSYYFEPLKEFVEEKI